MPSSFITNDYLGNDDDDDDDGDDGDANGYDPYFKPLDTNDIPNEYHIYIAMIHYHINIGL